MSDGQQTNQQRGSDALLSIVLPVYNEAGVLEELIAQVREAAAACCRRYELIFVDDGSADGSAELLDFLAAENSNIKVVHFSRNFGHQAAVQAGLAHAAGDAVVLMDSDLQDDPAAIGRFFEKWQQGYDVVYALRTKRKEGLLKRTCFGAFHRILSRVSSTSIPQDAGIFGLLDAEVVRQIESLSEHDRYLPGLRSWVGFRQTGVVVERKARYDDQPRVSLLGLWRLAKTAIFSFSSFPLTVFSFIGYSALLVFVSLSGFALYCKLFTSLAIPGWTSHVLSGSFFGALNALGISMLGEYVTRIYDQVRDRPLYLVARKVNFSDDAVIEEIAAQAGKELKTATPLLDSSHMELASYPYEADGLYEDLLDEATALVDEVEAMRASMNQETRGKSSADQDLATVPFSSADV